MSEKKELLITDNDPKVEAFKKKRVKDRKQNKEDIEAYLSEFYSGNALKCLMEDLYPNKTPNDLIPAKKYLSDLGKSTSLAHQIQALQTELNPRGPLWSEVNRLCEEGRHFKKCEELIVEIKKIVPEKHKSLVDGIAKLENQGPSPTVVQYFENLLKELKSKPKSSANQKPSRYVSALKSVLIRQVPSLKSKSDDIMKYISENEAEFKKKFKNSLEFNREIEKKLSELKKCKDIEDIEKVFKI